MPAPRTIEKYGLTWDAWLTPLQIEFMMIQAGGHIQHEGVTYGNGLFYHYKEAQTLCWPTDDHHRWSDLMLKTILEERLTAVMGARDSSKTYTLSKFALVDYWAFPQSTLSLMSSTDLRGLELRVWGNVKDLFQRARDLHDWLPGNVVDGKHGIFTDELMDNGDVRDIRKGILCIPCLGSQGEWSGGLEKFLGIKQKRRRLIGDECFPGWTLVDTPFGQKRIDTISPGDLVISAFGPNQVLAVGKQNRYLMLKVWTGDGRIVVCTPEHPFLTNKGWVKACELGRGHYILGYYETMQILRSGDGSQNFLQLLLYGEVYDKNERGTVKDLHCGAKAEGECDCTSEDAVEFKSDARSCGLPKSQHDFEIKGPSSVDSWREWHRNDNGGISVGVFDSGFGLELLHQNGQMEWKRFSTGLQSGRCHTRIEIGDRSRWRISQFSEEAIQGHEEGFVSSGAWVESVEIYKPFDSPEPEYGPAGNTVYNLQVANHPSYSVNGFIVHNCQFMPMNYLNCLANLDKGDFKAALVGNPLGPGNPLDKVAEPVAGWDSLGEVKKTMTWRNRFDGVTINLVGWDSPNFDSPEDKPTPYSYLIDRKDIERVVKRYGKDSMQFWSQIAGVRKAGINAHCVLTRELCLQHDAFKPCIWSGEETTKVYGIDAGYGGDLCIGIMVEFGKDVTGQQVMKFFQPTIIPVQLSVPESPEDQIANFAKAECKRLEIPDENVFVEAGMRATLIVSLSRIMSSRINAVNFGGAATDRPVSNDLFIFDEKTRTRRLKRCNEHYSKFVSEIWFSVRALVESNQCRELPEAVADEFYLREWRFVTGDRYELETKAECKERTGFSPNNADAAGVAVEGARRLGFVIERIPEVGEDGEGQADWLYLEVEKHKRLVKAKELSYD